MIYEITKYVTSADYQRLFEIAQHTSVICFIRYSDEGDPPSFDVAHTRFGRSMFEIGSRGTTYTSAFSFDEFVAECKRCEVSFIEPPLLEEAIA